MKKFAQQDKVEALDNHLPTSEYHCTAQ